MLLSLSLTLSLQINCIKFNWKIYGHKEAQHNRRNEMNSIRFDGVARLLADFWCDYLIIMWIFNVLFYILRMKFLPLGWLFFWMFFFSPLYFFFLHLFENTQWKKKKREKTNRNEIDLKINLLLEIKSERRKKCFLIYCAEILHRQKQNKHARTHIKKNMIFIIFSDF